MANRDDMRKQQQLIFDKLEGKRKEEFFASYFESEVMFALKELRKEKKMTQKDIAKRSGLKQGNISKFENLDKTPTLTTIGKYLFALEYSIEEVEELTSRIIVNFSMDESLSLFFKYKESNKCSDESDLWQGAIPNKELKLRVVGSNGK